MNNILVQALLGQVAPGVNPATNIADRLSEMAQSNPMLAPLIQQLQSRVNSPQSSVIDAQAEEVDSEPVITPREESHALKSCRKLKRLAREMFAELKVLRARNEMLAAALGACQACWGDDRDCTFCRGAGQPGAYLIDTRVFDQLVEPALEQLRQRRPLVRPQANRTNITSLEANDLGEQRYAL